MADNTNRTLFEGLGAAETSSPERPTERQRPRGYLADRETQLAQLTRGDLVEKALYWVDPARCRMWPGHNRSYELLSEERCTDLIDAFKAQGRQEFPAVVRRLDSDTEYDYEVVCGARRHWTVSWLRTHNYAEFRFLIEVRDLTDEQAFRLSDTENRDRADISDYERAIDYRQALKRYYRTQKEMAKRMQVSQAWLSEYLDLGQLPTEIAEAYPSVTTIRVQHSRYLKPLLKDRRLRQLILTKARALKREQSERREKGEPPLDAQTIIRFLVAVKGAKAKRRNEPLAVYPAPGGEPLLEVTKSGETLVLKAYVDRAPDQEALFAVCRQALSEHMN